MDVEQLAQTDVVLPSMDVEVTTVPRTPITIGRSPAAVYVIADRLAQPDGVWAPFEIPRFYRGIITPTLRQYTLELVEDVGENEGDEELVKKKNDRKVKMRYIDSSENARSSEEKKKEIRTTVFGRGFEGLDGQ